MILIISKFFSLFLFAGVDRSRRVTCTMHVVWSCFLLFVFEFCFKMIWSMAWQMVMAVGERKEKKIYELKRANWVVSLSYIVCESRPGPRTHVDDGGAARRSISWPFCTYSEQPVWPLYLSLVSLSLSLSFCNQLTLINQRFIPGWCQQIGTESA